MNNLKIFVKKLLRIKIFYILFGHFFLRIYLKFIAYQHQLKCLFNSDSIRIICKKTYRCIKLNHKHSIYVYDYIISFDYYFSSVKNYKNGFYDVIDFSKPAYHELNGYELHPVFFPSASEPLITAEQYLEFAQLKDSDNVIDLGAYSGLTSILFKSAVGQNGNVVAVEADNYNIQAIKKNFNLYNKITQLNIHLFEGAIYKNDHGLLYASEGNMGSSSSDVLQYRSRGIEKKVPSITLSGLAGKYNLGRVDFIKCDIEGGELEIFDDEQFFNKYRPKIIVEPHYVNNILSSNLVISTLKKYNYEVREIEQFGVDLPLLEFSHNNK